MRIGRVALHAAHGEKGIQRTAATDLHHLAHLIRAGGFAHQADGHAFVVVLHPVQQSDRAVQRVAFFVTGDGDHDRAIWWGGLNKVHSRRNKGRDARFHIGRTTPPKLAVFFLGSEGIDRPSRQIAHGHHIGMAIKAKAARMAFVTPTGEQVGDAATVDTGAGKARLGQHFFQQNKGAAFFWRDRGAADQIGGQCDGIDCHGVFLDSLGPWLTRSEPEGKCG